MEQLVARIWRRAKQWNKVPLGPINLWIRAARHTPISRNTPRRPFHHSGHREPGSHAKAAMSPAVTTCETALLIGVGPGLGFALARKLAGCGMKVALASRQAERLEPLVRELTQSGCAARAYGCDATDERSVHDLMGLVVSELGTPHLVAYAVQGFGPGKVVDVEVAAFEESWRQNCLGGFIVAREAARRMLPLRRGSIVLVGSTSSLIGRAAHLNLAVGKFGLRALAQVLARELWHQGIHVAHLVIDADIKEDGACASGEPQADPDHLAELLYSLHRQPSSAWTSELDARPWNERFWEHC